MTHPPPLRTATLRTTTPRRHPGRDPQSQGSISDLDRARMEHHLRHETYSLHGRDAEAALIPVQAALTTLTWALPRSAAALRAALVENRRLPRWAYPPLDTSEAEAALAVAHRELANNLHPAADAARNKMAAAATTVAAFTAVRGPGRDAAEANNDFTAWSLGEYGTPTGDTLAAAYALLDVRPRTADRGPVLTEAQVLATFQNAIDTAAPGWTVRPREMAARLMVNQSERTVFVATGSTLDAAAVRRLLIHEVGAHVLRALNAGAAPGSLAAIPLGQDAMATEEGLAVWWEHRTGVSDPEVMRTYAARTVAVDLAQHTGIWEVYQTLTGWVPPADAAAIAVRVKRGVADPTLPGAFTKDHVYLSGFHQVRDYLARNPERVDDLMSTKWGLSLRPLLDDIRAAGLLPASPPRTPQDLVDIASWTERGTGHG